MTHTKLIYLGILVGVLVEFISNSSARAITPTKDSFNTQVLVEKCQEILSSDRVRQVSPAVDNSVCEKLLSKTIENPTEGASLRHKITQRIYEMMENYQEAINYVLNRSPLCRNEQTENVTKRAPIPLNEVHSVSSSEGKLKIWLKGKVCPDLYSRSVASKKNPEENSDEDISDEQARIIEENYLDTDAIVDRD